MRLRATIGREEIEVRVPAAEYSAQAVLSAAHLLSGRAAPHVEEAGGEYRVSLWVRPAPERSALQALAEDFELALDNQALRQDLVDRNRAILEHIVPRALRPPPATGPEGAPEEALSPEQNAEIDRLIAQAEAEIAERARRKASADPLGIARTWEETRGKG